MSFAHYLIIGCVFLFLLSVFFAVVVLFVRHRKGTLKNILPAARTDAHPMVHLMRWVKETGDEQAFMSLGEKMVKNQAVRTEADLLASFQPPKESPLPPT